MAENGSIEISASGTDGYVSVADTGIWLRIPEGAIDDTVVLTFTRLAVSDDTPLPVAAEDT